jgi:hypothetical protein
MFEYLFYCISLCIVNNIEIMSKIFFKNVYVAVSVEVKR